MSIAVTVVSAENDYEQQELQTQKENTKHNVARWRGRVSAGLRPVCASFAVYLLLASPLWPARSSAPPHSRG